MIITLRQKDCVYSNVIYRYKIVDKNGKRAVININNWITESIFETNQRWYPDAIDVNIADPIGAIKRYSIGLYKGHPEFVLKLIEKLEEISGKYDS